MATSDDDYPYRECSDCGALPNRHPTTHLRAKGISACVDTALVPLLRTLWVAGAVMRYSCIGGTGSSDDTWPDDGWAQLVFCDGPSLALAYDVLRRIIDAHADIAMRGRFNGHTRMPYRLVGDDGTLHAGICEQPEEVMWVTTARASHAWLLQPPEETMLSRPADLLLTLSLPTTDALTLSGWLTDELVDTTS